MQWLPGFFLCHLSRRYGGGFDNDYVCLDTDCIDGCFGS
jgi:hypothetical protein